MKKYFLVFVAFFYSLLGFSTETVIKGKVSGFDQKKIKIGKYKNYITNDKEWFESTLISEGAFNITFSLEETTQILLKIEDKETSFFAESGKVYNLKLSYDAVANRGQAFNKFLDLKFPFPQTGETNQLIKKFNNDYQELFAAHYKRIAIKGAVKETNEFIQKWKKNEEVKSNPFVNEYVTYSIANLEDIRGMSDEQLFESYLKNQPILYHQKEYINFFKQLYREDLNQLLLKKDGKELLKTILLEENYKQALKEIKKIKEINDPALAELYLLYGFFDIYHKKVMKKESILNMLKQASESGETPNNKDIAKNMIKVFEKMNRSKEAPDFNLKNTLSAEKSLADFKGKPIYLNFWSNTSIPSLRELKVIQRLEEKYGDKIQFVSINLDDDTSINQNVKKNNAYNWTFLHFGGDYELIEKYQVTVTPTYFLINDTGIIIKAFAEGPVEIEETLYRLTR